MKEEKIEYEKLNAWITKHQKEYLAMKANIEGTSTGDITRRAINLYENVEALQNTIHEVSKIIDKQVDISIKKNMDRIVKLIVKAIMSSESANHNTAEILSSVKKIDINEVKETAYHYASNYLRRGGAADE